MIYNWESWRALLFFLSGLMASHLGNVQLIDLHL